MQGTHLYNILSEGEAQEGGKLRKVPWWGRAREAGGGTRAHHGQENNSWRLPLPRPAERSFGR